MPCFSCHSSDPCNCNEQLLILPSGPQGEPGPQGPPGLQGPKGDTGPKGDAGANAQETLGKASVSFSLSGIQYVVQASQYKTGSGLLHKVWENGQYVNPKVCDLIFNIYALEIDSGTWIDAIQGGYVKGIDISSNGSIRITFVDTPSNMGFVDFRIVIIG